MSHFVKQRVPNLRLTGKRSLILVSRMLTGVVVMPVGDAIADLGETLHVRLNLPDNGGLPRLRVDGASFSDGWHCISRRLGFMTNVSAPDGMIGWRRAKTRDVAGGYGFLGQLSDGSTQLQVSDSGRCGNAGRIVLVKRAVRMNNITGKRRGYRECETKRS